jgi:glutamyl-tRNA reductase
MHLLVIGLNHRSTPVELREQVAFRADDVSRAVVSLASEAGLYEAAILSTCNRTELYGTAISVHAQERILSFLASDRGVDPAVIKSFIYCLRDADAVTHLFRVSSGLDSLVMGEPQILGQVGAAYQLAHSASTTGARLSRLFYNALEIGKQIRSSTALGSSPVSVATISIQLARRLLGDLALARVLVVGAGEMCETAAMLAAERMPRRLVVINRTFDKAQQVAVKAGGTAVDWSELQTEMAQADLILTGTGSTVPIIRQEMLRNAVEHRSDGRLVIVDMGLPRDVEMTADCLERVFLYDIDDLKGIAEENLRQRMAEVPRAEEMIAHATEKYMAWLETLSVVPTIVDIRSRFEQIRESEIQQHLGKINGLDERGVQRIEQLTQAIVNKILHEPQVRLKRRVADHTGGVLAESLRYLFALDEEEGEQE